MITASISPYRTSCRWGYLVALLRTRYQLYARFFNAKFLVGSEKVVVGEGDVTRTGWNIGMYKRRLPEFVESFYYKNGDFLRIKLAALHLAFSGIPSGKILAACEMAGSSIL